MLQVSERGIVGPPRAGAGQNQPEGHPEPGRNDGAGVRPGNHRRRHTSGGDLPGQEEVPAHARSIARVLKIVTLPVATSKTLVAAPHWYNQDWPAFAKLGIFDRNQAGEPQQRRKHDD